MLHCCAIMDLNGTKDILEKVQTLRQNIDPFHAPDHNYMKTFLHWRHLVKLASRWR